MDSVFFACNGAVYLTNRVFSPVAYISVSFPALVNETMNIINWAIDQYDYDVYLNSQNSVYSFFIPTNHGLLTYVDPCSFGKNQTQILSSITTRVPRRKRRKYVLSFLIMTLRQE